MLDMVLAIVEKVLSRANSVGKEIDMYVSYDVVCTPENGDFQRCQVMLIVMKTKRGKQWSRERLGLPSKDVLSNRHRIWLLQI